MRNRDIFMYKFMIVFAVFVLFFVTYELIKLICPLKLSTGIFLLTLAIISAVSTGFLIFNLIHQKLFFFKTIFECSNDAMAIIDENGKYIWQNDSNKEFVGFSDNELKEQHPLLYIDDSVYMSTKEQLDKTKELFGMFKIKSQIGMKDVFISAFRVVDELDDIVCYVEVKSSKQKFMQILEDMEEEKDRVLKTINQDPLTGILNRNGFFNHIKEKNNSFVKNSCMVFIDIDNFKLVNDTYGHHIGDKVLKHTASIISKNIRMNDIFGRFGGEEFVILIGTNLQITRNICEDIRYLLENTKMDNIYVTCSIGISEIQDLQIEEAIAMADIAMYKAKKNGKNRIEIYSDGLIK